MPCYSVNTLSVELQASDRELLKKALDKLNLKYKQLRNGTLNIFTDLGTISLQDDQATLPTTAQEILNDIKRQYSFESIEQSAEEFNWTVTEEGEYLMMRRYS